MCYQNVIKEKEKLIADQLAEIDELRRQLMRDNIVFLDHEPIPMGTKEMVSHSICIFCLKKRWKIYNAWLAVSVM